MKANELRIGNYVQLDGLKKPIRVSIIDTTETSTQTKYKPMPLKEEWLLKHGFFVENFDYSIPISECKVVWLTLIPQDEECTAYSICVTQTDEDEDDQNVFLSDISYVHQVQNLYFALTGKELTINEPISI